MTENHATNRHVSHEDIALALAGGDPNKCYPPTDEQRAVLDAPFAPSLVVAGAGSGKTHVLAQRVIRLLLAGIDPAKILCLTFTKAAAANMANRVFGTLARWVSLSDDELQAKTGEFKERLAKGEPALPDEDRLVRSARRVDAERRRRKRD